MLTTKDLIQQFNDDPYHAHAAERAALLTPAEAVKAAGVAAHGWRLVEGWLATKHGFKSFQPVSGGTNASPRDTNGHLTLGIRWGKGDLQAGCRIYGPDGVLAQAKYFAIDCGGAVDILFYEAAYRYALLAASQMAGAVMRDRA
jgi:hypothetical protein